MNRKQRFRVIMIRAAALLVAAGVVASGGCNQGQEETHQAAFLLVQSSKGFEYDGKRLTVLGTSPTTVFFSDRPDRIAGHMPLQQAYDWGRSNDDSFVDDPPNATLSILEKGEIGNVVVTMSNGIIEGDSISFDVDVLEGELPARGGPNTLFIDVLGRPLTPLSVAGMHRRTRRRSAAFGLYVGAAPPPAPVPAAYPTPSSLPPATTGAAGSGSGLPVDQELADLKDMLDQGVITQEQYDDRKKQLLKGE